MVRLGSMLAACLRCLFVALLLSVTCTFSQEPRASSTRPAGCPVSKFKGEVFAGQEFAQEFGDDIVFRLRSQGDAGWEIQIHGKSDEQRKRDFLFVATPPYRSWNPRYVYASYGYSASDMVKLNQREFSFVSNREQFDAFDRAFQTWNSYGPTEQEKKEATEFLITAPRCSGTLRILDSKLQQGPGGEDNILWLKFEVELGSPKKTEPL